MQEFKINGINYFNPLEGKFDAIIEYFVKFYGEKHRERIEKRLKNVTFLFIPEIDTPYRVPSRRIAELLKDSEEKPKSLGENLAFANKFFTGMPQLDNIDEETKSKIDILKEYEDELLTWDKEHAENITKIFKKYFPNYQSEGQSVVSTICFFEQYQNIMIKSKKGFDKLYKPNILEFAKKLGFDFGDDFSALFNNEPFLDILFDENLFKELENEKKRFANVRIKTKYLSEAVETICNLDNKEGSLDLVEFVYNMAFGGILAPGGFASTYLDHNDNPKSIICLSLGSPSIDTTIIHELNHFIEMNILYSDEKGFVEKSGFDILENPFNKDSYNGENLFKERSAIYSKHENRKYEKLNEVINDYITQKICDIIKEDGFKISVQTDWKTKSDYRDGFMFIKDIVDKNLDTIIQCRLSKDPNAMAQIIGQENFDRWAGIVDEWIMKAKEDVPEEVFIFLNKINDMIADYSENDAYAE